MEEEEVSWEGEENGIERALEKERKRERREKESLREEKEGEREGRNCKSSNAIACLMEGEEKYVEGREES